MDKQNAKRVCDVCLEHEAWEESVRRESAQSSMSALHNQPGVVWRTGMPKQIDIHVLGARSKSIKGTNEDYQGHEIFTALCWVIFARHTNTVTGRTARTEQRGTTPSENDPKTYPGSLIREELA